MVVIDNKGVVFPYYGLKKNKDSEAAQEVMILFAAVNNPDNPGAVVFSIAGSYPTPVIWQPWKKAVCPSWQKRLRKCSRIFICRADYRVGIISGRGGGVSPCPYEIKFKINGNLSKYCKIT